MKLIILMLITFNLSLIALKDAVAQYLLNDVETNLDLKSRLTYEESTSKKWGYYSNIIVDLSFPKIDTFFDISPQFEFAHYTNHLGQPIDSKARLTESYIELAGSLGRLSIGERRLSFEGGRFISDSTFALLPRTFSQLSLSTFQSSLQLYYLSSVVSPLSIDRHYFKKGSVVLAIKNITFTDFHQTNFHVYALEDLNNTYSFSNQFNLSNGHTFYSTIAYQTKPSIKNTTSDVSNTLFYDAIYTSTINKQQFKLGTRFFQGGPNNTTGFSAPYSSSYSWDGILSIYQSNIKSGFTDNFRSLFGTIKTPLSEFRTITFDWFLFRDNALKKNYGAEINLNVKEQVITNSIFWFYKLGYYFSGTHSSQPSELKMWLDFLISIDD